MRPDPAGLLGLARSLAIYYGQPWRRRSLRRFYAPLVAPGELVFDIGAHAGSRTRTLLSLGARVVAAEPQPIFADLIERFAAGPRLILVREAIGREASTIDLHISSRHPTVSSVSASWIATVGRTPGFKGVVWDRVQRVGMTTLDALMAEHGCPSFCKIDVEGAEADILAGLGRPIPLVAFEYIPAAIGIAEEAIGHLGRLGRYRFNRVEGEHHRFLHDEWITPAAMLVELCALEPDAPSGDLYARLDPS